VLEKKKANMLKKKMANEFVCARPFQLGRDVGGPACRRPPLQPLMEISKEFQSLIMQACHGLLLLPESGFATNGVETSKAET
jgi:hypothetical protein